MAQLIPGHDSARRQQETVAARGSIRQGMGFVVFLGFFNPRQAYKLMSHQNLVVNSASLMGYSYHSAQVVAGNSASSPSSAAYTIFPPWCRLWYYMTTLTDDEVFQQWGLGSLVRNRQASRLLRPAPDPKFGTEGEAWIKMWKALSTQRIPSSSITAQGGRPSRQAQV